MKAAARMRRSRARRKAGRRVLRVEVDEVALEVILTDLGHLAPLRADDTEAMEAALAEMLNKLCEAYSRCA